MSTLVGRELDAAVATALGLHVRPMGDEWMAWESKAAHDAGAEGWILKHYSTEPNDANEILEWVGPQYASIDNGYHEGADGKIAGGWFVMVALCQGIGQASAPTWMEAMCRALIMAINADPAEGLI